MTHTPRPLTSEERMAVERYLKTLGTLPPLTADEESALSARALDGDAAAVEQLTHANLPFVVSVASGYAGQGMSMQDLINEGNIGLMLAARQYDARQGKRFVQYAVWKVRQAIEQALRHVGSTMPASLDAPLSAGTHTTLHDVVGDADAAGWQGDTDELLAQMHMLTPRETEVVKRFYGLDTERLTYQEIAMQMDLKRERVRQILKNAIRKIQKAKAITQ